MVIAVDAMGGDFAPEATVTGAVQSASRVQGEIVLVGRAERIEMLLPGGRSRPANLRIADASQVIGMEEDPGRAVRAKPDSSLAVAVNLVRDGDADAAVSAGNSGAFMFLARVRLRCMAGLQRPAIAVPLPGPDGPRILLDAGANVDCKPIHLAQFGLMGSIYAECALGRTQPRVGLFSIGHEPGKGDELTRDAHKLLRTAPLNFVGNIEGNQIFSEDVDVIVADGFVGNAVVKVAEGMAQMFVGSMREKLTSSLRSRLGGWLIHPALKQLRADVDYASYGGALLLGVNRICVVCHGRSNARAIENAILVAEQAVAGKVCERLAEGLRGLETAVEKTEKIKAHTA